MPSCIHCLPRGKGRPDPRRQPQCGSQVRPLDSMLGRFSGSRVHPLLDFFLYYLLLASSLSRWHSAITGRRLALRLRRAFSSVCYRRLLSYEPRSPGALLYAQVEPFKQTWQAEWTSRSLATLCRDSGLKASSSVSPNFVPGSLTITGHG